MNSNNLSVIYIFMSDITKYHLNNPNLLNVHKIESNRIILQIFI